MVADANAPVPAAEKEPRKQKGESTASGRYIPYSGGSAGWFENSGVLKSERQNNYHFNVEMDLPEVRARQFVRWGEAADRRGGAPRARLELPIRLTQRGQTQRLTTFDINNRGLRLQLTEAASFTVGESCRVELLNPVDDSVLANLEAQVAWASEEGATRTLLNVGLFFPQPTPEQAVVLNALTEA